MRTGAAARRRHLAHAAIPVVVLVVLAASCSSGSSGDDDDPVGPDGVAPAPAEPIDGGRVTIGLGGPIVADPVDASLASASDLMVLDLLHDGLARLSAEGTPQPALASEWRSNEERSAWRFTLDPEATFSDGEPITPAHVISSLERVAAAGATSLAALRLEHVQGFEAFVSGENERLEGLSAPDGSTVRVALDEPMSILPQLLASPVYGVVDDEALAGADGDLAGVPLSGSWAVADAGEDGSFVLERIDARPGHLDEIELAVHDSPSAAYGAFNEGEVDWALVPGERLDDALEAHGDEHFAPFHAELVFGMNVRSDHLLSNRRLRQAIAAAIDRDAIVDEVYADLAEPLTAIVPAGIVGHDPDRCGDCGHDPGRAEELLEAAFPDGEVPSVRIDFDESPGQQAMAELVASDLEAVGIPTTLSPRPLEDYKGFVVSGDQELFSYGWIGVYGSPDVYLTPQLLSSADDNLTGFRSAEVDELLADARRSGAPDERLELWGRVEAEALAAAVIVPIAQFRTQAVVADRVQELVHAVDGTVDWTQVWVADA